MRPTSRELIERIADALTETVLPAVAHDKWAASTVRSATTLLAHLAARVERELPVLVADNADAAATLEAVRARLGPEQMPAALAERLAVLLDEPRPEHDAEALDAQNRRYQEIIEALLRTLYEAAQQGGPAADGRALLRNYLGRRRVRERDIYFPAFLGPPF